MSNNAGDPRTTPTLSRRKRTNSSLSAALSVSGRRASATPAPDAQDVWPAGSTLSGPCSSHACLIAGATIGASPRAAMRGRPRPPHSHHEDGGSLHANSPERLCRETAVQLLGVAHALAATRSTMPSPRSCFFCLRIFCLRLSLRSDFRIDFFSGAAHRAPQCTSTPTPPTARHHP